jgi:hypothetical protein
MKQLYILIFIIMVFFTNVVAYEQKCDISAVLEKIEYLLEGEYSINEFKELKSIFYGLTPAEKECLSEIVKKEYPTPKSFKIVMLFSLFHDKQLISIIQKLYLRQKKGYIKAQCEVYFFCAGFDKEKYMKRYIARLNDIKKPDEVLIYVALPTQEKRVTHALLKYCADGKLGDGATAEKWYGIMSWVERNGQWLVNDNYLYLDTRLKKEGLRPIDENK